LCIRSCCVYLVKFDPSLPFLTYDVRNRTEGNSKYNDDAADCRLPVRVNTEQYDNVLDNGDNRCSDQCSCRISNSSCQGEASDNRCGDGVHGPVFTYGCLG